MSNPATTGGHVKTVCIPEDNGNAGSLCKEQVCAASTSIQFKLYPKIELSCFVSKELPILQLIF